MYSFIVIETLTNYRLGDKHLVPLKSTDHVDYNGPPGKANKPNTHGIIFHIIILQRIIFKDASSLRVNDCNSFPWKMPKIAKKLFLVMFDCFILPRNQFPWVFSIFNGIQNHVSVSLFSMEKLSIVNKFMYSILTM